MQYISRGQDQTHVVRIRLTWSGSGSLATDKYTERL